MLRTKQVNHYNIIPASTQLNIYHQAIIHNDAQSIEEFLLRRRALNNAALNQRNAEGLTPLAAAVKAKNLQIVQLLVESGEDIYINEECGPSKVTALSLALMAEDYKTVAVLVTHDHIELNSSFVTRNILGSSDYHRLFDKEKVDIVIDIVNHNNFDKDCLAEFFNNYPKIIPHEFWIEYISRPTAIVYYEENDQIHSLLQAMFAAEATADPVVAALLKSGKEIGLNRLYEGSNVLTNALFSGVDDECIDAYIFYKSNLAVLDHLLDRQDLDL